MKPQTIEVHIDTLVIRGFDCLDRHMFAACVETHLRELLQTRGVSAALLPGNVDTLDGGTVQIKQHDALSRRDGRIAEAIYMSMRK